MEALRRRETHQARSGGAASRRIAVVVPDGMGVRNFLCGRLLPSLARDHEIVVLHALPDEVCRSHRERLGARVHWRRLPDFREGMTERLCRVAKVYARLHRSHRGHALRALLASHAPARGIRSRLFEAAARAVGRLSASNAGVRYLDARHARQTRSAGYFRTFVDLMRDLAPDLVFLTHQRASRAVPVLLAARERGIPTVSFIYSWDNVPKGRLAVHSDHFLAWSAAMRDEILRHHPQVDATQIHVTGTPQFEPYFDPALVPAREEFLRGLGLDPERRAILFSGDDRATSPYDPVFLEDVACALRELPERVRPQLVFRRCPADGGARFESVLTRHPEIARAEPLWSVPAAGDWTQAVPRPEDVVALAGLVEHCDAVVNFASTMCMDFALKDKPGIYLRYEPAPDRGLWSVEQIYRLPHFDSVHRFQPVHWIRGRAHIADVVLHALEDPGERGRARRLWIENHLALPVACASQRIRDTLVRLSGAPQACMSASS